MTRTPSIRLDPDNDQAEMIAIYRRLATMDPPALHWLAVDLQRLSDESAASAALHADPAMQAKARRDADRAAAALAVLASVKSAA